jgi:hypothetical protein
MEIPSCLGHMNPLLLSPLFGILTPLNTLSSTHNLPHHYNNVPPNSPASSLQPTVPPRSHSVPPIACLPDSVDPRHLEIPVIDEDNVAMWDEDDPSDDSDADADDSMNYSSDCSFDNDYHHIHPHFPDFETEPLNHDYVHCWPNVHKTYLSIPEHHTIVPFEYTTAMVHNQFPCSSISIPMMSITVDGVDEIRCDMLEDCHSQAHADTLPSITNPSPALILALTTCSYTLEQIYQPKTAHSTICKYHLALLCHIGAAMRDGIACLDHLFNGPIWNWLIKDFPNNTLRQFFLDKTYVQHYADSTPSFPFPEQDLSILDNYDKFFLSNAIILFHHFHCHYLTHTIYNA